jgi:hypothetical protein
MEDHPRCQYVWGFVRFDRFPCPHQRGGVPLVSCAEDCVVKVSVKNRGQERCNGWRQTVKENWKLAPND